MFFNWNCVTFDPFIHNYRTWWQEPKSFLHRGEGCLCLSGLGWGIASLSLLELVHLWPIQENSKATCG